MADLDDGDYFIINGRSVSTGSNIGDTPIYRCYNPYGGDHMFTKNYNEYLDLLGKGWNAEGIAFVVDSGNTNIPVYRMYNRYSGEHFFTENSVEMANLRNAGWTYEGIAFVGALPSVGRAPVYRLYNKYNGKHMFTTDVGERNYLIRIGWTNESIAFYSGGVYALNNTGNSTRDGSNIDIFPYTQTDAQIWRVTTMSDGSRRIMNRSCGKSLDVLGGNWDNGNHGSYYNGQTVGLYHDYNGSNQKWNIIKTGTMQRFQGYYYAEYWINLWGNPNGHVWNLEVDGADDWDSLAPGKNVDISYGDDWHQGDFNDRSWIFVPVPKFRPNGGIYSIRPLLDPSKYLTATSTVNGANVNIQSRRSGDNNQLWILTKGVGNNTYQIRNVASSRMLDVSSGVMANGTNVQVWNDNDSGAQQWGITSYGEEVYNAVSYRCVRFDIGNYPWCLDITAARSYNNTNVQIYINNDTYAQRWLLIPETATDPNIPVPQNLYLNSGVGRMEAGDRAYQDRLYPGWSCTDAWFVGENHYEFDWRIRYCRCGSGSWTGWTSWHGWNPVGTTTSGNNSWVSEGIDTSYNTQIYKNAEIEYWVRCVGTQEDYTWLLKGGSASCTHRNTFVPSFTFDTAGISFDCLRVPYTTDYPSGYCYLYLKQLQYRRSNSDAWQNILTEEITYQNLDSSGSIEIPLDYLNKAIQNGSNIRLIYQVGNDQQKHWTWRTWSGDVTASRTAGNVTIDFQAYSYIRHTAVVAIPNMAKTHAWFIFKNKTYPLIEIKNPGHGIPVDSSKKYFLVPYIWQYGVATIAASVASADGDRWGMNATYLDTLPLDHARVHVWITEDAHIACLDCREGQTLESDIDLQSDSNTVILNNREHEFVTFGKTIKNSFSAEGALMYSDEFGYTDCDVDDLKALVSTHCLYRNPHGDVMNVAVTGVSVKMHHHYATVTVSMTEETR